MKRIPFSKDMTVEQLNMYLTQCYYLGEQPHPDACVLIKGWIETVNQLERKAELDTAQAENELEGGE